MENPEVSKMCESPINFVPLNFSPIPPIPPVSLDDDELDVKHNSRAELREEPTKERDRSKSPERNTKSKGKRKPRGEGGRRGAESTRKWCFTQFRTDEEEKTLTEIKFAERLETTFQEIKEKIKCYSFQLESCPDTGKIHIQGMVVFDSNTPPIVKSAMQKILGNMTTHCEPIRNIDDQWWYCQDPKKRWGDSWWEFGSPGRAKKKKEKKRSSFIPRRC